MHFLEFQEIPFSAQPRFGIFHSFLLIVSVAWDMSLALDRLVVLDMSLVFCFCFGIVSVVLDISLAFSCFWIFHLLFGIVSVVCVGISIVFGSFS